MSKQFVINPVPLYFCFILVATQFASVQADRRLDVNPFVVLAQQDSHIDCSRCALGSSLAVSPLHSCAPGSALGVAWVHPRTTPCTAVAYLVLDTVHIDYGTFTKDRSWEYFQISDLNTPGLDLDALDLSMKETFRT